MLMAKVKYSTMVESASGATGDDVVYSEWKGIKYVRSYARPAQPRTEKQVAQRTAFAEVVSAWHHLPAVVEMVWDVAAEGKPLSGYNLFMKRNIALQKQGKALVGVPDFSPPVPSVGAVQATSPSTGTLQVTWKDHPASRKGKSMSTGRGKQMPDGRRHQRAPSIWECKPFQFLLSALGHTMLRSFLLNRQENAVRLSNKLG